MARHTSTPRCLGGGVSIAAAPRACGGSQIPMWCVLFWGGGGMMACWPRGLHSPPPQKRGGATAPKRPGAARIYATTKGGGVWASRGGGHPTKTQGLVPHYFKMNDWLKIGDLASEVAHGTTDGGPASYTTYSPAPPLPPPTPSRGARSHVGTQDFRTFSMRCAWRVGGLSLMAQRVLRIRLPPLIAVGSGDFGPFRDAIEQSAEVEANEQRVASTARAKGDDTRGVSLVLPSFVFHPWYGRPCPTPPPPQAPSPSCHIP